MAGPLDSGRMDHFRFPHHFHVNTRGGDLHIPEGAIVHVDDNDHYIGHEIDGEEHLHARTEPLPHKKEEHHGKAEHVAKKRAAEE